MSYGIDEVKLSDKNMRLLKKLNEQTQKVAIGIDKSVEEMKGVDALQGTVNFWEYLSNIIYDIFGDEGYVLRPQDVNQFKKYTDDIANYLGIIDGTISIELPRINNKKELSDNLKIYCRDYFNNTLEILVEDTEISNDEFIEQMREKKMLLVESFIRRAGFDFNELYLPASASESQQGVDGR